MMDAGRIESAILEIANDAVKNGPGYAQEAVVLREVANRLNLTNLEEQQELLTCWHRLFYTGTLAWGYDVDNPSSPFFHIPRNGKE